MSTRHLLYESINTENLYEYYFISIFLKKIGNSCWSFFTPVGDDATPLSPKDVNNEILIKALSDIGIPGAQVQGRNDIVLNSKKVYYKFIYF